MWRKKTPFARKKGEIWNLHIHTYYIRTSSEWARLSNYTDCRYASLISIWHISYFVPLLRTPHQTILRSSNTKHHDTGCPWRVPIEKKGGKKKNQNKAQEYGDTAKTQFFSHKSILLYYTAVGTSTFQPPQIQSIFPHQHFLTALLSPNVPSLSPLEGLHCRYAGFLFF